MSDKLFNCPACDHEFRRRNHAKCPNCGATLKDIPVRRMEGNVTKLEVLTTLADPQEPEVVQAHLEKNKPPEPEVKIGQLVSQFDDVPQVYYLGEKEIVNRHTGASKKVKTFRAEFVGIIYTGWVYCPNCWRKLFQNQFMDTGQMHLEQQCKDCYAITNFIFVSNRHQYR